MFKSLGPVVVGTSTHSLVWTSTTSSTVVDIMGVGPLRPWLTARVDVLRCVRPHQSTHSL